MLAVLLLLTALQLPPLSWTCPMHPEVVENTRGSCPICRMPLEPVRLDLVWSCPIHSAITSQTAGRCPVCGRDLVRVTMSVSWTCDGGTTTQLAPGTCPDGSMASIKYAARPHGNHNPQHGGQFFMASDNWHHLEGAYPRAGVFRVYLYDDYSKPLPRGQVQRITGSVAYGRSEFRLRADAEGRYLETTIPADRLPIELTLRLKFQADAPDSRFDFAFMAYSIDRPQQTAASAAPAASDASTATGHSVPDLLKELHARADQIDAAIKRRAFPEIWVPALRAKDLALAIQAQAPDARRFPIDSAVTGIVRAAWLLDAVGDQGNAVEVDAAYARFAAAVARLDAALAERK